MNRQLLYLINFFVILEYHYFLLDYKIKVNLFMIIELKVKVSNSDFHVCDANEAFILSQKVKIVIYFVIINAMLS